MAITRSPTVIVAESGDGPTLPLPDGRLVRIRSVPSTDGAQRLRLSVAGPQTVPLLFLTIHPGLGGDVDHLLQLDGHARSVVIATVGHELVAIGHVDRRPDPDQAEVALVVAEGLRDLGIETALFGTLASQARSAGATSVSRAGEMS